MEALHEPNNHMYPYLEGDSHAQLVSPYLEPLKKNFDVISIFFFVKTPWIRGEVSSLCLEFFQNLVRWMS